MLTPEEVRHKRAELLKRLQVKAAHDLEKLIDEALLSDSFQRRLDGHVNYQRLKSLACSTTDVKSC